ncbi:MAG: hypothetical protein M3Z85_19835 [Acidobacteriota bacterium]|nr:hypothetical protein [Acidobacteriota bacterium]
MGAPSQTEGGTGGQGAPKKYTTTEANWQHRAQHGMGIGSEFLDAGKTMVVIKIGEPYQDGKRLLIDTWAIEKQAGASGAVSAPATGPSGKRGRFREFIEKKPEKEEEK